MNFTREPIIETIISAKDGYKLAIKSTKATQRDEYLVDAVEVVSFGGSFFYRCQERPKTFFIPVNDFELLEVKETRILIKNPNIDRSIKIAGGKESTRVQKSDDDQSADQKRDKKRGRRPRAKSTQELTTKPTTKETTKQFDKKQTSTTPPPIPEELGQEQKPTVFSHLLTPPPGLISESLFKYKQEEETPKTLAIEDEKKIKKTTTKKTKLKPEVESSLKNEELNQTKLEAPMVKKTDRTELPKPGEALEDKEITSEAFAKASTDKDLK